MNSMPSLRRGQKTTFDLCRKSHSHLPLFLSSFPPSSNFLPTHWRPRLNVSRFRKRRTFESLYPKANPLAIDFLSKTLTCKSAFIPLSPRKIKSWLTLLHPFSHSNSRSSKTLHSRTMPRSPLSRRLPRPRRRTVRQTASALILWVWYGERWYFKGRAKEAVVWGDYGV